MSVHPCHNLRFLFIFLLPWFLRQKFPPLRWLPCVEESRATPQTFPQQGYSTNLWYSRVSFDFTVILCDVVRSALLIVHMYMTLQLLSCKASWAKTNMPVISAGIMVIPAQWNNYSLTSLAPVYSFSYQICVLGLGCADLSVFLTGKKLILYFLLERKDREVMSESFLKTPSDPRIFWLVPFTRLTPCTFFIR